MSSGYHPQTDGHIDGRINKCYGSIFESTNELLWKAQIVVVTICLDAWICVCVCLVLCMCMVKVICMFILSMCVFCSSICVYENVHVYVYKNKLFMRQCMCTCMPLFLVLYIMPVMKQMKLIIIIQTISKNLLLENEQVEIKENIKACKIIRLRYHTNVLIFPWWLFSIII